MSCAADIASLGNGRGWWLGIAAAFVALLLLAGFLGRDFYGFDTEPIGYQTDSLSVDSGRSASPDGLQAGSADDASSFEMTTPPDGASGGAANGVPGGAAGSVAGVTGTTTKSSTSSTTAKSSGGTAIDSTALDALFREAADELVVGK